MQDETIKKDMHAHSHSEHAHGAHTHEHRGDRMAERPLGERIIEINSLSVTYKNNVALKDITFNVYQGEFLAIIGPNGGGKTTLLKAILGLCRKSSGYVRIYGSADRRESEKIGYVPQFSLVDRAFPISVREVVMCALLGRGLHPFRRFTAEDKKRADSYLEKVHIRELADRHISALSGGEFQRLLIARALACEPEILILDEPTASVDPLSRSHIYTLLDELNRAGMTIIMVTHDMMAVSSSVGRIACLNKRLAYHGEPELTQEVCDEMYGCPIDLIAHGVPHRVLGGHSHDTEGGCC